MFQKKIKKKRLILNMKEIVSKERKILNMKIKERKSIWRLWKRKEIIEGIKSTTERIHLEITQIVERRVKVKIALATARLTHKQA